MSDPGRACAPAFSGMTMFRKDPPAPVLTPCIGICEVGPDDRCVGCLRTLDEIARWGIMNDHERIRIMRDELPRRAGGTSPSGG